MADYDQRPRRGRGGYNNRKRRYGDEDDSRDGGYDRRNQRRRYEEPLSVKVRKQLLSIAESPLKRVEEEVSSIAKTVADNFEDAELRRTFEELSLQLVVEQPFKIPFVSAVLVVLNDLKGEVVEAIIGRAVVQVERAVKQGEWREVKLLMKFLGGLQGILEDDGVFPVLQDLLTKAVELQTENSEDNLGPELVKVILFTIPYIMASSATDAKEKAASMIENTDIIASEPHVLQPLVDPYPGNGKEDANAPTSVLQLLQKQLAAEAEKGWELACLPRPWKTVLGRDLEELVAVTSPKHILPTINIPEVLNPGPRALFPELYFSVYANQDLETVPPITDIASCLLRDAIIDTINILDYNRNITAKFLIDIDCYFSPDTFVKRATPFDRLRDIEGDRSTWKPEDVAVDAVFSQLFQLPFPEHKLVYYHSVLTEACKIAPAAIAPSLGRAIRYLYRSVDSMDLELSYRFMDWFSHHLSNFGFTWKWTEWIDDVELPSLDPKKAFIRGSLDKEIRLSFAQRIKGTLPAPYQQLITAEKEKDTPDFKYDNDQTPFATEGRELKELLRKKAPEEAMEPIIAKIQEEALAHNLPLSPIHYSTDAYVTSICYIGSKSLSHVLSCIERCKDRLLASSEARGQIIESVMQYWKDQPGIGVNIVDKLLNYTILSPASVIEWALEESGNNLAESAVYEMVASTVGKVTRRVRDVVKSRDAADTSPEQRAPFQEAIDIERRGMKELFKLMEDKLQGWATGSKDQMLDGRGVTDEESKMIKQWGERWLRVFRRKGAVEEAWYLERDRVIPVDGEAEPIKMDEDPTMDIQ